MAGCDDKTYFRVIPEVMGGGNGVRGRMMIEELVRRTPEISSSILGNTMSPDFLTCAKFP